MDAELKVHINETGKYRSEYLTFAIQNLSKLDAYKDYIDKRYSTTSTKILLPESKNYKI